MALTAAFRHGLVIGSVDVRQMLEEGVVRRRRVLSPMDRRVVERIRGDERTTVKIRRQHERGRPNPVHQRHRLAAGMLERAQ